MKVTSIIYTALLAVASVDAAASAAPNAEAIHHFCYRPGQPCSKMKRAAEAVAEAIAAPHPDAEAEAARNRWCYRPGQPCSKAKRDALAYAEAVAEAYASADAEPEAGMST